MKASARLETRNKLLQEIKTIDCQMGFMTKIEPSYRHAEAARTALARRTELAHELTTLGFHAPEVAKGEVE